MRENSKKKQERVGQFVKLIQEGVSRRSDFSKFAKNKGWGNEVTPQTINNYIRIAVIEASNHIFLKSPQLAHDSAINTYTEIIKRALELDDDGKGLQIAIQAQDRIVKLLKIDERIYFQDEVKKEEKVHAKSLDEIRKRLAKGKV